MQAGSCSAFVPLKHREQHSGYHWQRIAYADCVARNARTAISLILESFRFIIGRSVTVAGRRQALLSVKSLESSSFLVDIASVAGACILLWPVASL